MMKSNQSLFLRQSYMDAWGDYQRSLRSSSFVCWDYVILTASNEEQAEAYRLQLKVRAAKGLLCERTHFAVIADTDGKRVGSGGATLGVLRYIAQREGAGEGNPFAKRRILVIHSGGDSKRVPQYSARGKLFSPVPRELPNGKRSTLFDEFIIGMSGVAPRMSEGMLVLSGDVLLLFNPLQIDVGTQGAAAISFKEEVETGKDHGVFSMDEDGLVGDFLHKQSVQTLKRMGAVNDRGMVDIDTGAIIFGVPVLLALYGLICTQGVLDEARFQAFVNERVRLSFYGDFLYPLATHSTLEAFYLEKPEGEQSPALMACRKQLWEALRPFRMKLLRLSPAAFIHFGTTRELLGLVCGKVERYAFLDWSRQVSCSIQAGDFATNNALISEQAEIASGCYIEDSMVKDGTRVCSGSILSGVTLSEGEVGPDTVLHGLRLLSSQFVVRAYGTRDNPKLSLESGATLLGVTLEHFMQMNQITPQELWDGPDHTLWTARLYPACATIQEAMRQAFNVCAMARGEGDAQAWRNQERQSLCAGFNQADAQAIIGWEIRLRKLIKMERFMRLIASGGTYQQAREIFAGVQINDYQIAWLEERIADADFSTRIRALYYMGKVLGGTQGERWIDRCFAEIQQGVLESALSGLHEDRTAHIAVDEACVNLPLRVNFGGGWSDTPPYCLEHGGTVLNAAITLGGQLPVEAKLWRLKDRCIMLCSADIGAQAEFTSLKTLADCSNPYDTFALHKAALIACGVIPASGGDWDELLDRLGGGFAIATKVTGVPKGSGLGTSSILAGACVKAIYAFLGKEIGPDELYDRVLCMEQIMSTGGGWQDQVGGMTPGIKYIRSEPGMKQRLKVTQVEIPALAMQELSERFVIIYTGQRRLARNLLRDVVGRYIGHNAQALDALEKIQQMAALMRFELERGNIDGFAALLDEHWALSKQIDKGSTNTCIDQIFLAVEDMLCGRMICGAGGGGFLQGVLRRGVSREQLRARLREVFEDSGVDVWDCTLV